MKTIYLDIFSGISGDMFIGAMLDIGVDFKQLQHDISKLKVEGYHLHAARKQKANIEGVKFDVHLAEAHEHEHEHENGHGHHQHREHEEHEHEHGGHDHGHRH